MEVVRWGWCRVEMGVVKGGGDEDGGNEGWRW